MIPPAEVKRRQIEQLSGPLPVGWSREEANRIIAKLISQVEALEGKPFTRANTEGGK